MSVLSLTDQIKQVLQTYEEARNDDLWLTCKLWTIYHQRVIERDHENKAFVYLRDISSLPREDHIKRIRAKLQNEQGLYLPTDPETIKKRSKHENKWKKWARDTR